MHGQVPRTLFVKRCARGRCFPVTTAAQRLVILTALDIEYDAVRAYLTDLVPRHHPTGTIFEVGDLPGAPWQVAIGVTGPGNVDAGVLAERAVTMFAPAAMLFVGIAGALKDWLALGDVVVATKVFAYHGGRDDDAGFQARPRSWDASHRLEQLARHTARADPRPLREGGARPAIHFLPIAAGEVVLNSPSSPLARQLSSRYNDAVAIEMESAGVCAAGHLNGNLPTLTIRGISDTIHAAKADAERAGWPWLAAEHAAAFAARLVRLLPGPEQVDGAPLAAPRTAAPHVQVNSASGGVVYAVQAGNQSILGAPPDPGTPPRR